MISCINVNAQNKGIGIVYLDTLQQIYNTNTPSKYFAKLYYQAVTKANHYVGLQQDCTRQFILGFESSFTQFFFKSYRNFIENKPQIFSWQRYYQDTTLTELQYQFMGMNAHINGDMWVALKDRFCSDTIKKYKKPLIAFQKSLDVFFDSVYSTTNKYKKIKKLHSFTFGLDKTLGRKMILHWRKRQVKMALLWYSNNERCLRKWKKLQRKMKKFDRFALKAMV